MKVVLTKNFDINFLWVNFDDFGYEKVFFFTPFPNETGFRLVIRLC